MATKAAAKKTTSKDKIGFLERQCEQLTKERMELAAACEGLKREIDNLKAAEEKKSSRNWVLRKLGL